MTTDTICRPCVRRRAPFRGSSRSGARVPIARRSAELAPRPRDRTERLRSPDPGAPARTPPENTRSPRPAPRPPPSGFGSSRGPRRASTPLAATRAPRSGSAGSIRTRPTARDVVAREAVRRDADAKKGDGHADHLQSREQPGIGRKLPPVRRRKDEDEEQEESHQPDHEDGRRAAGGRSSIRAVSPSRAEPLREAGCSRAWNGPRDE